MSTSKGDRMPPDRFYPLPVEPGRRRMAILAEGCFSPLGAKTAVCLVRYIPEEVVAVIDSSRAPSTAREQLGFGGDIPVVRSLDDALAHGPDTLVLGTAPRGGSLSASERTVIIAALSAGLHVINGMHRFLNEDPELVRLARSAGVVMWDARRPPPGLGVSSGEECPHCPVILTIGSDCNTGKMTSAMEITRGLASRGHRTGFAASGQTGIMITGTGIPVDRVIADFIGGATERLVLENAAGSDYVILEGQGSIIHPGYAGVTVGMIAGSMPHGMILCHQPTRTVVRNYTVPIPPLPDLIALYEDAIRGIKKVPVLGIALNTFDLDEDRARVAIRRARTETGLPVTDPVRFGADRLIEAILAVRGSGRSFNR